MEHTRGSVLGLCWIPTHSALLAEHLLAQAKGGWSAHLRLQNPALLSDKRDTHPRSTQTITRKQLQPLLHNSCKQTAPTVSSGAAFALGSSFYHGIQ